MKRFGAVALLLATSACAHSGAATCAKTASDKPFEVSTAEQRGTMEGGSEHFTGTATIAMLFAPEGARDFSGAYVTFEPGARTAWHSHPAGQTLVVTEGTGWVQTEGGERRDIRPGDVVWTPPGVRHWHGATDTTAMTHMAVQGQVGDEVVNWQEQVSDAQYLGQ